MVVLNSRIPSTNAVIEAMKLGAFDFLRKESLSYELRPVVEDALKTRESMKSTSRRWCRRSTTCSRRSSANRRRCRGYSK